MCGERDPTEQDGPVAPITPGDLGPQPRPLRTRASETSSARARIPAATTPGSPATPVAVATAARNVRKRRFELVLVGLAGRAVQRGFDEAAGEDARSGAWTGSSWSLASRRRATAPRFRQGGPPVAPTGRPPRRVAESSRHALHRHRPDVRRAGGATGGRLGETAVPSLDDAMRELQAGAGPRAAAPVFAGGSSKRVGRRGRRGRPGRARSRFGTSWRRGDRDGRRGPIRAWSRLGSGARAELVLGAARGATAEAVAPSRPASIGADRTACSVGFAFAHIGALAPAPDVAATVGLV